MVHTSSDQTGAIVHSGRSGANEARHCGNTEGGTSSKVTLKRRKLKLGLCCMILRCIYVHSFFLACSCPLVIVLFAFFPEFFPAGLSCFLTPGVFG